MGESPLTRRTRVSISTHAPAAGISSVLAQGTFTALVPDEVREIVGGIDLDDLREERRRALNIERLAEALTELCGIVSVSDLVAQYERVYSERITRDQVLATAFDAIERDPDGPVFEVWTGGATDGTATSSIGA